MSLQFPSGRAKDIYHFPFHSFNYIHASLRSSCHRNFDDMDYYLTTMALIQAWPIVMAFAYGLVPNKAANVRLYSTALLKMHIAAGNLW